MADISKEQLDDLFRQGAEQHEFDYNPAAWNRMEQLLDRDARRRRGLWWLATLLILSLIGGTAWLIYFSSDTSPISTSQQSPAEQLHRKRERAQVPAQLKSAPTESRTPPAPAPVRPQAQRGENASDSLDHPSQKLKEFPKSIAALPPVTFGSEADQVSASKAENANADIPYAPLLAPDPAEANPAIEKQTEKNKAVVQPTLPIPGTESELLIRPSSEDLPQLPPLRLPGTKSGRPANVNRLMIGLHGGLEWNAVGFSNFSSPGWNTGLKLEYQYARHYTISLGTTYSRKAYLASGNQYEAPPGFWQGNGLPSRVDGTCHILELPVQVGYHLGGYRQSGFFATAGLTSYFMLRERYDYEFEQPNPGQVPSWRGTRRNQHWFGIGQFSVGYQYRLSKRVNLQLAPFVQIPFTGIGHGNVRLYSIGTHLRVYFQAL